MSNNSAPSPKLQPPGAGLPLPQRIFLRLWLGPIVSRRTSQAKSRAQYEHLTQKLVQVSEVPSQKRNTQILVNPIPGLEDSSRYWSLNQVLDHLLIVSRSMEGVILSLSSGKIPEGQADPAKVKPGKADRDLLHEFSGYAPELLKTIDEKLARPGMDIHSKLRFRHQWFGGLTTPQWYWLLASHQAIHYRQAKEIIRGLEQ